MSEADDGYDVKRCAKCAAWIPTSATMCSYCGTTSPDEPLVRPKGSILSLRHGVRVTDVLIGVNCAYLLFAVLAEFHRDPAGRPMKWLLTADGFDEGLLRAGAYHHSLLARGEWWRVVTATFLHAGIVHIALNMFSLRNLGQFAEGLFGPAEFLTVYLASGVCSTLAVSIYYVWMLKRPPDATPLLVGASGAVFGVAGLLMVFLFRAGSDRGREIAKSLAINLAIMLFIGWRIPFVSNTGHVGGLVAGVAFGLTLRDRFSSRIDARSAALWSRVAVVCVGASGVALLWGAWFALTYKGGF